MVGKAKLDKNLSLRSVGRKPNIRGGAFLDPARASQSIAPGDLFVNGALVQIQTENPGFLSVLVLYQDLQSELHCSWVGKLTASVDLQL